MARDHCAGIDGKKSSREHIPRNTSEVRPVGWIKDAIFLTFEVSSAVTVRIGKNVTSGDCFRPKVDHGNYRRE